MNVNTFKVLLKLSFHEITVAIKRQYATDIHDYGRLFLKFKKGF